MSPIDSLTCLVTLHAQGWESDLPGAVWAWLPQNILASQPMSVLVTICDQRSPLQLEPAPQGRVAKEARPYGHMEPMVMSKFIWTSKEKKPTKTK